MIQVLAADAGGQDLLAPPYISFPVRDLARQHQLEDDYDRTRKGSVVGQVSHQVSSPIPAPSKKLRPPKFCGHIELTASIKTDLPPATLAYCAGIVDGEGSIYFRKIKKNRPNRNESYQHQVIVAVYNSNAAIMKWLVDTVGGVVSTARPRIDTNVFGTKPQHRWKLVRLLDCLFFLRAIAPYMIIKRDRALAAMAFIEQHLSTRGELQR